MVNVPFEIPREKSPGEKFLDKYERALREAIASQPEMVACQQLGLLDVTFHPQAGALIAKTRYPCRLVEIDGRQELYFARPEQEGVTRVRMD